MTKPNEASINDAKESYTADTVSFFDHDRMVVTWGSATNPDAWYSANAEYGDDHSVIPLWDTLTVETAP